MDDRELGWFLRSRREAVRPADVGLPEGSRRRTPGLRRAELATLAGISVDYLIRLEQGRDHRPSAQVVAALADALRLGPEDRRHLARLSLAEVGRELAPEVVPTATRVRPSVQALLDRLEPTPALVLNHLSDVLAWTPAYQSIGGPVGILDRQPPNLTWFTFCDPRARAAYPDWGRVADEQVANLRAGPCEARPEDAALVEELTERGGTAFADRWEARPVQRKGTGVKRLVHPEVGELRLAYETMALPDPDEQRLVAYLPADEATAEALDRLTGRRPGHLRAVPDDLGS